MKTFKGKLLAVALGLFGLSVVGGIAASVAWAQPTTVPLIATLNPTDAFQDIPLSTVASTNVYATAKQLTAFAFGGNVIRETEKPTLTSCSTTGGTIVGSDDAFILTGGSSASTTCTATFTTAYVNTPICTVASQTAPGTTTPSYTVSTTAVVITQASQSSEVYDVICKSQPGG